MSTSFYDLMKYAKLGIASPEMTYYDRLKASALFGGTAPDKTITGIPPLTLTAKKEGAATSYKLTGKTVQNGTPTPDAPIEIKGVGDRTYNLFDQNGVTTNELGETRVGVELPSGKYCITNLSNASCYWRIGVETSTSNQINPRAPYVYVNAHDTLVVWVDVSSNKNIMLNSGSTALPYEPYGHRVTFTNNGTTSATIYTDKPLYGTGDVMDEYDSTGKIVRKWRELVLTGEENWYTAVSDTGLFGIQRFEPMQVQPFIPGYSAVSNYYVYNPVQSGVDAATVSGEFALQAFRAGTAWQYNFFIKDGRYNALTSFKSFLQQQYAAGTPVTIVYPLETPTEETITAPLLTLAKGSNVIDVSTAVKPSEMSITGQIK